ncbi:EAL domain-containing protein [Gloeocapsa sp. PCC 73106]|uniref:EAL domain-containing protein n=1 Tax=Gloeocapsa sp. PCC 73106 TaxID=102232 RepID=UPI0002AC5BFC|nr:EAL domain-containing protein [Gloeocapsa sp. PCC 73106]ELR97703.1 PAS domain S-box/diguanylate cyclase (GGDEF) domain-containing protein [Gloeocapsa sp. PCC 73106]
MDNFSESPSHILVIEETTSRKTLLLKEPAYSFGRDPSNSVVLSSKKVSRYHATLLRRTDQDNSCYSFWIIDGNLEGERSKNGVFVNEKRSLVQSLKHGDIIIIGDIKLTYYVIQNMSDFVFLQGGDFDNTSKKVNSHQETLVEAKPELLGVEINKATSHNLVKLASFPELSPNPIIEIDWNGNITYFNPAALATFKNLSQTHLKHPILSGLANNPQQHQGSLFVREVKIDTDFFEQYVHYLPNEKLIRSYIFNFTKRKEIESSLRESKEVYHHLVKQSSEAICLIDRETQNIIEANKAYCDLLGYSTEESLNLKLTDVLAEEKTKEILTVRSEQELELAHQRKDGQIVLLTANFSSVTYRKKEIVCCSVRPVTTSSSPESFLSKSELYHKTTNLASQALFKELLSTNIANCKRNQQLTALLVLELAHFDEIRVSLGELKLPQLLQDIAKRLRSCLRAGDSVAHPYDSQFYVLLAEISQIKDSAKISQRLLDALRPPFEIDKQRIYLNVSIGIVVYDNEDPETFLNHGQIALNRSRQKGSNNYQFYQPHLTTEISRLLRLEKLLEEAIVKEEFLLYYQPRVNVKTKKIVAVEALLRWQHPDFGLITPDRFLPIAEEIGLIVPIGEWVIKKACQQNRTWQKLGLASFPIGVNLSLKQFQQPDLVARITSIVHKVGLDSKWLELELTEKTLLQKIDYSHSMVSEMKNLGLSLVLDDFQPTSSSVAYLKQFPIDSLKVHQSFMAQLKEKSLNVAAIASTIAMGRELDLAIVVEGVETIEQLKLLQNLGCEQMQGHLFSPALNAEDIYQFLAEPEQFFLD